MGKTPVHDLQESAVKLMGTHTQLEQDFRTALTKFRPIEFSQTVTGSVSVTISNVPVRPNTLKPLEVSSAVMRAIKRAGLPYYLVMTHCDVKSQTHTLRFVRKQGV
jgi:hypothetical protein